MDGSFRFADELDPLKLVHIWRPAIGVKAVVAIDNIACGPVIGGLRMAPHVGTEEGFRLARAMPATPHFWCGLLSRVLPAAGTPRISIRGPPAVLMQVNERREKRRKVRRMTKRAFRLAGAPRPWASRLRQRPAGLMLGDWE